MSLNRDCTVPKIHTLEKAARLDPNVVWGIKLSCFMRLGLKEVTIYLCKKQQSLAICVQMQQKIKTKKCANGHDCKNAAAKIVTKGC